MARLIETPALAGPLPAPDGRCRLTALPWAPIAAIAPFRGQEGAVAAALAPLGLAFPAPGQALAGAAGARILWAGRGTAFLIGAAPPPALAGIAAVTDQSDGWAGLRLEGPDHAAVLARLVPLDLRPAAFPAGRAARAPLNHVPALFTRAGPEAVELWVFRSMAATAVHELETAMIRVAARAAL